MAPAGGGKRKRGDRTWSGDSSHDIQRPSPHRPANLNLAQQAQGQNSNYGRDAHDGRGRGGRRPSRGGRGAMQNQNTMNGSTHMYSPDPRPSSPLNSVTRAQVDASKALDAPVASPTPVRASSMTPEPQSDPTPFDYTYLTDETCENWDASGRQATLETGVKAKEDENNALLCSLFQEVVRATLTGRLSPARAGELVKDIIGEGDVSMDEELNLPVGPNIWQATFLDALSVTSDASTGHLGSILQPLVFGSGISPDVLRQELEQPLLESLGLIRSTFSRMGIRKQTNLLYRQANFNLLREESEGFAKLMTELFTTSNNEPPSSEVVEETVERVKAMIGAFDLDVGRTLDVVLDVFGAVLVKQFRFFVKFLRASPWWPRDNLGAKKLDGHQHLGGLPQWALSSSSAWYLNDDQKDVMSRLREERDRAFWTRAKDIGMQAFYELGRQRLTDAERLNSDSTTEEIAAGEEQIYQKWTQQTGTLPPQGNRDAAQLLGFKLRFYSSSEARAESDVLPENLIYLSALLIKVGFISLKDLYPHIWRSDEDMEELRKEKIKEKLERERAGRPGASAKNALLMAGALADDTLPVPSRLRETGTRASTPAKDADTTNKTTPKDSKTGLPDATDQKVLLLQSLLAIGALPDALFILGRFPWLLDVYPDLTEYIHRILHHSLSQIYASVRPLSSRSSLQGQKPSTETDVPGVPKGQINLVDAPTRKTLRWALLDRDDTGFEGSDYKFYWDEWSDNVPVCQSVDDVFTLCETFLNLSGVRIGQDPTLLSKLARIGKFSLSEDRSELNRTRWFALCKRLLIPALSFTRSNAGVVNEVFEVLSAFPLDSRYTIYLEWSSGQTSRSADMKLAFEYARTETKDILKRISKTNLRPMARSLAKIAYANPHIVITTALNQIEVYDSIADTFVEGARYFTDLGYDILTWALISAMGRAGRSRTNTGGMFTSKWLVALASFAGKIFRRYNMMRPSPVLQYVADQLEKGNSTDLVVLEQIILSMAGITTDTNYNDAQIQAMGGGELLQSQTILQLLDRRHESRITSKRLMRSLRETDLTGRLLVSLAQRRQACCFDNESQDTNLKILANTFDELHRVLDQYLDLLRTNLSLEELKVLVPDVIQLLVEYGIDPEIAFTISRPVIAQRMAAVDKEDAEKRRIEGDVAKEVTNGDVEMTDQVNGVVEEDGEALDTEEILETAATPTAAEISGTSLNLDGPDKQAPATSTDSSIAAFTWHPVLQDIMDNIRSSLPQEVQEIVGIGFYVTFWQLSLYDITIPSKSYEDELSRQHKKMAAISADRTDISTAGIRRKEAEKKQITELRDRLLTENKDHIKAFTESKARLQREKDQWFAGMSRRYVQLNSALMEQCFLPRILCSPLDAFFCFKFAKLLHTYGTPNFRTLGFYDLIFKQDRLTSLIFTCTSKEADNLGRFLNEILRDLGRWHKDKTTFEKEAYGSKRTLPGFTMQLGSEKKPANFLTYEDYRRILFKWHNMVFSALQNCLSSPEYMHIRNAISILRSISQHFPEINFHGTALQATIAEIGKSELEDIMVSSTAIMGALNRRQKSWILPQAFRKGQDKVLNGEGKESNNVAGLPPTSKSDFGNAKAASSSAKEDSESQSIVKKVEDGQVNDAEVTEEGANVQELTEAVIDPDKSKLAANEVTKAENALPVSSTTPVVEDTSSELTISSDKTEVASQSRDNLGSNTTQPASIPQRLEPARGTPSSSSIRHHPNLPIKPERPDPRSLRSGDSRFPARPSLTSESPRNSRDVRSQDVPRHGDLPERNHLDRSGGYGPRGADRAGGDRQMSDRPEVGRNHERDNATRSIPEDRLSRPPMKERGPPMWDPERSSRSRVAPDAARGRQDVDRGPPEGPMAPPRPQSQPQSTAVTVNPERAALINGDLDNRPGISIRGQGDERSARTSRPTSPRRNDEHRPVHRSERADDNQPLADRHSLRSGQGPRHRPDDSPVPSSRDQRSDRSGPLSNDFHSRHHPPQQAPVDLSHGRLNQDPHYASRQQDQPRERSPPASDIPSGPRSRHAPPGARGRNAPPPPPPVNTQQPVQPNALTVSTGSGRHTPTGPSARSHVRNNSHHEQPPHSTQVPAPTTPAADTTGVHPDRLRHIQPSPSDESASRPAPFIGKGPPPSPTLGSPPSAPSGPRGGNAPSNAPSGPSPVVRAPPSGPLVGNDGTMRGPRNNRHPLAAVNNTLQQAGQGTSIRGRGGMRNSGPVTPHSGPPTPVSGPGQDIRSEVSFPPQQGNSRPDLFTSRGQEFNGNGSIPPQQHDHRPSSQRQSSHRDEFQATRPAPSGRRGELLDESNQGGRTSSRHSSREGTEARRGERDDHHDRDAQRSDRDPGRDRDRDRERDSGRERRSEGGDRHRESSSRRDEHSSTAPRGSGRGRDSGTDVAPAPPHPPMHGQEERRGPISTSTSGPGSGSGPRRGGDSRTYDERGEAGRKHGRGEDGAPYGNGGGGRGGMRVGSEGKRPRRGP